MLFNKENIRKISFMCTVFLSTIKIPKIKIKSIGAGLPPRQTRSFAFTFFSLKSHAVRRPKHAQPALVLCINSWQFIPSTNTPRMTSIAPITYGLSSMVDIDSRIAFLIIEVSRSSKLSFTR